MEKHLEPKSISFEYGGKEITLETGRIARQANAAVLVSVDQTQVLTTVVARKAIRFQAENKVFRPRCWSYACMRS